MDTTAGRPARPLRADAQRNRDALVATARAMLSAGEGPLVLDAVARETGVGIGTLYRHFPTLEALVEEVYAVELDELTASAPALLGELPPDQALREWLARYAHFAATKRGMIEAMRSGLFAGNLSTSVSRERLEAAIGSFLEAGARAGSLRSAVDASDVTTLLRGVFLSTSPNPAPGQVERLLDLLLDAVRSPGRGGGTIALSQDGGLRPGSDA